MIRLIKRPKPHILERNGTTWTRELMTYLYAGQDPPDNIANKYRHNNIKSEVKLETNGKCAYCESYVTHQYPGDIEHIIPKKVYPRLTFIWNNLTFVCFWCNNNKRAKIDKSCKLLNPYRDQINDHIRAFGPLILHINHSKRGELTHKEIKLNRSELIERRTESIKELQNLIDKYDMEQSISLKEILHHEIIDCTSFEREFSFCLQQYLTDRNFL